jgi:hypothetical protein
VATTPSDNPSQNEPLAPVNGGHQVSPHHVQRPVGQVDHVHDAKHQRQPGGQQEQHQPELQAIERLLQHKYRVHSRFPSYIVILRRALDDIELTKVNLSREFGC